MHAHAWYRETDMKQLDASTWIALASYERMALPYLQVMLYNQFLMFPMGTYRVSQYECLRCECHLFLYFTLHCHAIFNANSFLIKSYHMDDSTLAWIVLKCVQNGVTFAID